MKNALGWIETVFADDVYTDKKSVRFGQVIDSERQIFGRVKARHETVNGLLRRFAVLSSRFRQHLDLHHFCFFSVSNLTNLIMSDSDPLSDRFLQTQNSCTVMKSKVAASSIAPPREEWSSNESTSSLKCRKGH